LNKDTVSGCFFGADEMNRKGARQAALLQLVGDRNVANQREIVRALKKLGLDATQASVSRDVRELGLVKVNHRYVPMSRLSSAGGDGQEDPLYGLITATEPVGANLVVVRTATGAASVVAAALDRLGLEDVVGTLAGDDTIFLAVRSRSAQGRVIAHLRIWIVAR
jgi:transcriptional regulator of arginine metabolism